jgi:hypothetical protein
MPTYTYDERVGVCRAMDVAGSASCPRCGSAVDSLRMQTLQDKLLKRLGKPHYRCSNVRCACECTPLSHLTAAPIRVTGTEPPPSAA